MNNIIDNYEVIENTIINDISNENTINKYIDKIYIINLKTNKLREKYLSILMEKLNINYNKITVNQLSETLYYYVMQYLQRVIKKNIENVGCYMSHMWCLQDIIKNNYKNAIIFEDDIIVHKNFNSLFNRIVINENNKISYDFLMLGAVDYEIDKENKDFISNNIYIPKNYNIIGTHAIYYSLYGAKTVFDYGIDNPLYLYDKLNEIFSLFDKEKTGIIYPNLFTVEGVISKCCEKFDFCEYHFTYFDLINKACIMDINYYKNYDVNKLIKLLLMNYFNNDEKVSIKYLDRIKTDFFTTNDYLGLINTIINSFDRFFYKFYYNYCKEIKITPGTIIKNKNEYNKYSDRFWENKELKNKYPYLFHKQVLNIRDKLDITYEIIESTNIKRIYVSHLHCYDIDKFDEFYKEYYVKILEKMDIIVTYCVGNNIPKIDGTILKINNYGYDVGAKFSFMKYLIDKNIDYKYILFLQSKSCAIKRKILYESLINNLNYIFDTCNKDNIGGYFPPFTMTGSNYTIIYDNKYFYEKHLINIINVSHISNMECITDLQLYLNIDKDIKKITLFPYGNIYLLHRDIANILFTDIEIYNCLNDKTSFDYNWVKQHYNMQHNSIKFVYECYKKFNLCSNNLKLREIKNNFVASDFMIEHTFERLIFQVIKNLNMDIEIVPNGRNEEQIRSLSKKINGCYGKGHP